MCFGVWGLELLASSLDRTLGIGFRFWGEGVGLMSWRVLVSGVGLFTGLCSGAWGFGVRLLWGG